jgi:tRNA pseudouridine55 synthase
MATLDDLLVDTAVALESLPEIALGDDAANKVRLGNPVICRGRDAPLEAADAFATARGRLIAIGSVEAGMFKPRRVFTS